MNANAARRRAYKLALKLMRAELSKAAFDAKLVERYGVQTPYTLRLQRHYRELQESIKCLSSDLAKLKAARKGLPHEQH
jgi:hypothetical protein